MKYKTFIALRNFSIFLVITGGIVGLIIWMNSGGDAKEALANQQPVNTSSNQTPYAVSATTPQNSSNAGSSTSTSDYSLSKAPEITAAQEEIMALQKNTPMSEGKPDENNGGLKCFKKFPTFQVDLRCDKAKGFTTWNRLKIDWDYDKKWDEKWDFRANGSIKRQCSSNDDEVYDYIVETIDGKWAVK